MSSLELVFDSDKLARAFLQAPDKLERNLSQAIARIGHEIARTARDKAPKAFSTLTQSIRVMRPAPLEAVIAPATRYAERVERGTGIYGPARQASNKSPPEASILDWIRVRRIIPRERGTSQEDLAYLIARKIARTGTPAQPYLKPALDELRNTANRRIDAAIARTLKEVRNGV